MNENDSEDINTYSYTSQNSNEIITTDSNPFIRMPSSDNIEQIDQDKVQMELLDLKLTSTTVSEVLTSSKVEQKDNFDLLKFSIKVKAVYDYSWEFYRKPADVKKNFAEINSELSRNYLNPS